MDINVQIKCFIFSFIYGIIFNIFEKINFEIIKNNNSYIKYLDNCLFMLNFVLIFLIVDIKLNFGIIHPYFIIFIILGYYFTNIMTSFVEKIKVKLQRKKGML